jgi:uncharacterized repeat protein (TIGR03803 family)
MLWLTSAASGQVQESILHAFTGSGGLPSNLIVDSVGNLYGTTQIGGNTDSGTVFELSRTGNGGWSFRELYSFAGYPDGVQPVSGVVMDGRGNLYGTTSGGGTHNFGTVFELTPSSGGKWTETLIYSFGGEAADGEYPLAGLALDSSGNLYGTTAGGGTDSADCPGGSGGCGTAFVMTPSVAGQWNETVLYRFAGGSDGYNPVAALLLDGQGDLFGTTELGGNPLGCYLRSCGTAFELSPSEGGSWNETIIHRFDGRDGAMPYAGLIADSLGDLYGTASEGGDLSCNSSIYGCGTVFQLSPIGNGDYDLVLLHVFANQGGDGSTPYGGLALDKVGRLYGTTFDGGTGFSGTVFRLAQMNGKWNETIFEGLGANNGSWPIDGVTLGKAGLYGSTDRGGPSNAGVVFELTN